MFNGRYILIGTIVIALAIIWHSMHQSMLSFVLIGGLLVYGYRRFMGK